MWYLPLITILAVIYIFFRCKSKKSPKLLTFTTVAGNQRNVLKIFQDKEYKGFKNNSLVNRGIISDDDFMKIMFIVNNIELHATKISECNEIFHPQILKIQNKKYCLKSEVNSELEKNIETLLKYS